MGKGNKWFGKTKVVRFDCCAFLLASSSASFLFFFVSGPRLGKRAKRGCFRDRFLLSPSPLCGSEKCVWSREGAIAAAAAADERVGRVGGGLRKKVIGCGRLWREGGVRA